MCSIYIVHDIVLIQKQQSDWSRHIPESGQLAVHDVTRPLFPLNNIVWGTRLYKVNCAVIVPLLLLYQSLGYYLSVFDMVLKVVLCLPVFKPAYK